MLSVILLNVVAPVVWHKTEQRAIQCQKIVCTKLACFSSLDTLFQGGATLVCLVYSGKYKIWLKVSYITKHYFSDIRHMFKHWSELLVLFEILHKVGTLKKNITIFYCKTRDVRLAWLRSKSSCLKY